MPEPRPVRPILTRSTLLPTRPSALSSPSKGAAPTSEERASQAIQELRRKALAASGAVPPAPAKPAPANSKASRNTSAAALDETGPSRDSRRRQAEETRAQLLERLNNPLLSLHETSIILRVCPATVRRWANAGYLSCVRTTGGQRRFPWRDVQAFMHQSEARQR